MMSKLAFLSLLVAAVGVTVAIDPIDSEATFKLPFDNDFEAIEPVHVNSEASSMLTHYGKPPRGCSKDEAWLQINGVPGIVCAPRCSSKVPCPTDLPEGMTGKNRKIAPLLLIDTKRNISLIAHIETLSFISFQRLRSVL